MRIRHENNILDIYSATLYILSFIGVISSISYALRHVRGFYYWFHITDQNALLFYTGSLLILCSIFFSIVRLVGPVSFSISEIFWRYSTTSKIPSNPWKLKSTWIIGMLWALSIFILSIILAPTSIYWLVGSSLGAICFGAVIIQGLSASQILNNSLILDGWAIAAAIFGIFITIFSTVTNYSPIFSSISLYGATGMFLLGVILSLFFIIKTFNKPLDGMFTVKSYARKSLLIVALSNISSPESYKYYGSKNRFFRRKVKYSSPALISLISVLDSVANFAGIVIVSIPFGIFLGIAFGLFGAVSVTMIGAWVIANLYRWLIREWTAQPSLRIWLGGSYIQQAFEYALGSAFSSCLYVLVMTLIFGLPFHAVIIAFIFGLTVSLGEANPPTHINYDLVMTTPDGVVIQMETAKTFLVNTIIVLAHIGGIIMDPFIAVFITLSILFLRTINHWKIAC